MPVATEAGTTISRPIASGLCRGGPSAVACADPLRRRRKEQEVALDDCRGDVAELATVVLGVVAQHLERPLGSCRVAGHQDPLRLFDQGAAPERPLQGLVLAESLERDVDRALQLFRSAV